MSAIWQKNMILIWRPARFLDHLIRCGLIRSGEEYGANWSFLVLAWILILEVNLQ